MLASKNAFDGRCGCFPGQVAYLRPSSIAFLDDLGDGPAFRLALAREHVLDDHGGGESCGDVEDFEVTGGGC